MAEQPHLPHRLTDTKGDKEQNSDAVPISNSFGSDSIGDKAIRQDRVHVAVRVRPSEQDLPPQWLVRETSIEHELTGTYRYDRVYNETAGNETVFVNSVLPLVQQVVDGYNATVIAYGATGSGKTYTMQGTPGDWGVTPRCAAELFRLLSTSAEVSLNYFEVYNEGVFDLIDDSSNGAAPELKLRGASTETTGGLVETRILGQRSVLVTNSEELMNWIRIGDDRRRTQATQHNAHSSRSHAVVRIGVKKNGRMSALYLCDLAGSERALKDAERRREGSCINKSLLTLGTIISILSQGTGGHCPYRESKLTRLLQPSLSGAALLVVLCNVQLHAPSAQPVTLNTLRFASRAKNVPVSPRRGEASSSLLRQNEREVCGELQNASAESETLPSPPSELNVDHSSDEIAAHSTIAELRERNTDLEQQNMHFLEKVETLNHMVARIGSEYGLNMDLYVENNEQRLIIETLLAFGEDRKKFSDLHSGLLLKTSALMQDFRDKSRAI